MRVEGGGVVECPGSISGLRLPPVDNREGSLEGVVVWREGGRVGGGAVGDDGDNLRGGVGGKGGPQLSH